MRCNLHDYDIMEETKLEAARNFLMENLPEETIARCTGLSLESVQQLAEQLKAEPVLH